MKVQLVSDLHLEYQKDWGVDLLKSIEPKGDILVLAGDITYANHSMLDIVFNYTSHNWDNVVYIPGNHEFYNHNSIIEGWKVIKEVASRYPNIYALNNELVDIEGACLVYGGTGWFPPEHFKQLRKNISDFNQIKDVVPEAYNSNKDFKQMFDFYSKEGKIPNGPDLIVTHHLPDERCVAPQYKNDLLNQYFVSQFDVEYFNPKYWLHGHTHSPVNLKISNTQVLANPRGYKGENPNWTSDFVFEV